MNVKIGKIPLFSMLIFVFPYFHFGFLDFVVSILFLSPFRLHDIY